MRKKHGAIFILLFGVIGYFAYRYLGQKNEHHFSKFTKNNIVPIQKKNLTIINSAKTSDSKEETLLRAPSSRFPDKQDKLRAPKKNHSSLKHIDRSKLIFSTELNSYWKSDGVQYQLVKNLMAIKEEDFIPMQYESEGQLNGYYLVKKESDDYERSALAVVYNEDTKGVAIFTGILKIKFFDFEQASGLDEIIHSKLGRSIPMQIVEEYPHINMAFYKFDNFEQTMMVYDLLSSETLKETFERVTIDLLEWHRSTR